MTEIALSNKLNQIELEIQWHKENAGRSVWEIGRRLNHVKENDLAHGEFLLWLEKVNIEHTSAKRMMKVAEELPNSATLHHLGESALYLIATLPEEEREIEHETADGEVKPPDEMTVRELQDLKKQLKEKEEQIKAQQDIISKQADAKPQIIEKIVEVEKEVMHPHVEDLRSDNKQLSEALRKAKTKADAAVRRNEFIEKELNELLDQRKEVNEKSRKYEELTEGIRKLEGKMNENQQMLASQKRVLDTIRGGNDLLDKLSGLIYATDLETIQGNNLVLSELNKLIGRVEWWFNDLNKKIDSTTILEGEIIYDK